MRTYIALLRGVTPTGKNKVPMACLRELLTSVDFKNVRTYIQSGNVLVDTELSAVEVERRIRELIKQRIGPDLAVIVRTGTELRQVLSSSPYKKGYDSSRLFFVLFNEAPGLDKTKQLIMQDFGDEKLHLNKTSAAMYIPGTYGRGKLSSRYLEKCLGVIATMRNFNTMSKLIELS